MSLKGFSKCRSRRLAALAGRFNNAPPSAVIHRTGSVVCKCHSRRTPPWPGTWIPQRITGLARADITLLVEQTVAHCSIQADTLLRPRGLNALPSHSSSADHALPQSRALLCNLRSSVTRLEGPLIGTESWNGECHRILSGTASKSPWLACFTSLSRRPRRSRYLLVKRLLGRAPQYSMLICAPLEAV